MVLLDVTADLGLVTLVGGALALDRRGAFQLMVSQPLVVVPILGLMLGNLPHALWMGAVVQLLWLSSLNVGASVPQNETLASVAIGGAALMYARHVGPLDPAVMTLCLLAGAPVALAGRWVDVRLDRENLSLCARADEAAQAGSPFALSRLPALGLLRTFITEGALIAAGLAICLAATTWLRSVLTPAPLKALSVMWTYVLPALGLAVAMTTVRRRRALLLTALAFVTVIVGLRSLEVQ